MNLKAWESAFTRKSYKDGLKKDPFPLTLHAEKGGLLSAILKRWLNIKSTLWVFSFFSFASKKNPTYVGLILRRGEGGIRTPGTLLGVRQFSKLLLSATQAPLLFIKTEGKSKKKSIWKRDAQ